MPLDMRTGIIQSAQALGISPVDLATIISYETGGTFNPTQVGPTTKYGVQRGLLQFGEPQAKQYGVDWNDPIGSQLGPNGAIVKYLKATGVKPGMALPDVYSAVNTGHVGNMAATDAGQGGAPGTVADKVATMQPHQQKAVAFLNQSRGGPVEAAGGGAGSEAAGSQVASMYDFSQPTGKFDKPAPGPVEPYTPGTKLPLPPSSPDPYSGLASTLASATRGSAQGITGGDTGSEALGLTPAPEFSSAVPPPAIGHRAWDPLPQISIAPDTSQLAGLFKVREDTGQARTPITDAQGQPIIRRMRG